MTQIINITGYKFISLEHLPVLQADITAALTPTGVLGTLLLADEGINVALAGTQQSIDRARDWFRSQPAFADLWFKQSQSSFTPFSKLKIKIRHEIIAFDGGKLRPQDNPAPMLSPAQLKQWLDDGRDMTLLDTRNSYEVESGTFDGAVSLGIDNFREFTSAAAQLDPEGMTHPIVTFCTGGVRCEKAAPWLIEHGFKEVYQIEGGIVNYFEQCGGEHWTGECFVFDDRVEIDTSLAETGSILCTNCHRAINQEAQGSPMYVPGDSCPNCF